ncbi:UNVERIFIED_CONTAM: hypothetical protein OHV15_06630 [Microbacterium sp. SLM126]
MRTTISAVILLSLGLLGLGAQSATAAPPGTVADVEILPTAFLSDDGSAIAARVRTLCAPDGTVWEGYIPVMQGAVFSSAELRLVCDGRPHVQKVLLDVIAPAEGEFTRGEAEISAVIVDEGTLTPFDRDTETVRVR